MRRRQRHQVKPTAATHFPSLSRGPDVNQNAYMFAEDVHLAVMPIGGRTEKHKNFAVAVEGPTNACERARDVLGGIGRFDRHNLAGMACDAVEEIARQLAWEGQAVFEIIQDDGEVTHVHGFTSKRLVRIPGWFLQIIPRGDRDLWKKKWVIIPAGRIWKLEMPSVLGGRKGYKMVLTRLRRFERLGPHFWKEDLERGDQSKYFNFQQYVMTAEVYYGRVTRTWGWNRRDWSQERSTEFFTFYKMVTFRWAQAVLREHVISEINGLFVRLGMDCILRVSGLPTSDEILGVRGELLSGNISFSRVADIVTI